MKGLQRAAIHLSAIKTEKLLLLTPGHRECVFPVQCCNDDDDSYTVSITYWPLSVDHYRHDFLYLCLPPPFLDGSSSVSFLAPKILLLLIDRRETHTPNQLLNWDDFSTVDLRAMLFVTRSCGIVCSLFSSAIIHIRNG